MRFWLISALWVVVSLPAFAQDARITGRVLTADLHPVLAALVHIVEPETGRRRVVLSNSQGAFSLPVPRGQYRIEAVKPGYQLELPLLVSVQPGVVTEIALRLIAAQPAASSVRAICAAPSLPGDAALEDCADLYAAALSLAFLWP